MRFVDGSFLTEQFFNNFSRLYYIIYSISQLLLYILYALGLSSYID